MVSAHGSLIPACCHATALQPATIPGLLAVLPPNVRWLELDAAPCAGPLLPALARFRQLQRLTITGNGADIEWDVGTPTVLAPLQQLCLDYRRPPVTLADRSMEFIVETMPGAAKQALSAATGLHTLELRLTWSDDVAAACHALPALHHLRWALPLAPWTPTCTGPAHHLTLQPLPVYPHHSLHVYECANEHGAAAVQLLRALTQLTSVELGIHGSFGSELDNYPTLDQWEEYVFLPLLAGLSALTELCLVGGADLPPDFRQLSQLQRLAVTAGCSEELGDFNWGGAPLTALASLTRVEINQGAYMLHGMHMPGEHLRAGSGMHACCAASCR